MGNIKLFKSQDSDLFYIETVGQGHIEDFVFERNGDYFVIDRLNTKIKDVNNAKFDVFCDDQGNPFQDADELEQYLINAKIPFKPLYDCVVSSDYSRLGQTTEGLINQTTLFENYLSLTVTPSQDLLCKLSTCFVWSHNANGDNFHAELVVNDDQNSVEQRHRFVSHEAKEVGGTGEALNIVSGSIVTGSINSGTDVRNTTYYSDLFNLSSGVEYNFSLEWAGQSVNDRAAIYKGYIDVEQKFK